MGADLLHDWTTELARDPRSLVFLRLADLLRKQGRLAEARRVALGGLERHPYLPDAHDVFARILVDAGEEDAACDEWEMALRLDDGHAGALKGLGFLAWRRRDLVLAERLLARAVERDPGDEGLAGAYRRVQEDQQAATRRATPPAVSRVDGTSHHAPAPGRHQPGPRGDDPRTLFAPLLGDGDRTALLLDRDGLVVAGAYVDGNGREVSDVIGAHLAGLADEAARALEHLGLGPWESLLVESQHATVALGPSADGATVLVAAARDSQVGFVRRLLARAVRRAATWMEVAV